MTIATREIKSVRVLTPDGLTRSPAAAIDFIEAFDESRPESSFARFEVGVRYSNGDEIRGQFTEKAAAIVFLRDMR
jgi:hypothetical protein